MVNKFLALPIITTGPGSDGNVSLSFTVFQNSLPLLTCALFAATKGGHANFILKSANRKSAHS
jgi:hypothetical protein